jgi:hypothetical protein
MVLTTRNDSLYDKIEDRTPLIAFSVLGIENANESSIRSTTLIWIVQFIPMHSILVRLADSILWDCLLLALFGRQSWLSNIYQSSVLQSSIQDFSVHLKTKMSLSKLAVKPGKYSTYWFLRRIVLVRWSLISCDQCGLLCVEFVLTGWSRNWSPRKPTLPKKQSHRIKKTKVDRKVVLSLAITLFLPLLNQIHHHTDH